MAHVPGREPSCPPTNISSNLCAAEERSHDMFWKRRKPAWFIEPSRVASGSVAEDGSGNPSRSHVRVEHHREPEARFLPLATFVPRCQPVIRGGRSLAIEHPLVAPIVKRRYAKFFDRLTECGPARRRASGSTRRHRRAEARDG
jgi:hypothetical protein